MLQQKLKAILDFVRETDLQEVIWEKGEDRISFRRGEVKAQPVAGASESAEEAAPPEPIFIRSTMVGTFFRSDSADRPPLVVEGTEVTSGQPVASIEAMKIRKDVVAPATCRIVKSLVADGHAVEYGQPLFEVEDVGDELNGN